MQRLNSPEGITSAQWSYITKLRNEILKSDSNSMTAAGADTVGGDHNADDVMALSETEELGHTLLCNGGLFSRIEVSG